MTDDQLITKYKTVVKELESGQSLRRAALLGGCSLGTAQKIKAAMTCQSAKLLTVSMS
jgi:hypothetical protein